MDLRCWSVFLLAVVTLVTAEPAQLAQCAKAKTPISGFEMDVPGCSEASNCPLRRGTTYIVHVSYDAPRNTTGLLMNIFGTVSRIRVPYHRNVSICEHTTASDGTTCSSTHGIVQGKRYTTKYEFPVRTYFPMIPVPVEFEFSEGNGTRVYCVQLKVTVVCGPKDKNCQS